MKVLLASSEVYPFSKTGGLADVSSALTKYLHAAGHDVRLFTPLYSSINRSKFPMQPVEGLQKMDIGGHMAGRFLPAGAPSPAA